MATPFESYKAFKYQRDEGRTWLDLPKCSSHHGDKFKVSPMHSSVELIRAGQKTAGSKNYWESPKIFSEYLAIVIAKEIGDLGEKALLLMDKELKIKAKQCEETIKEIKKDMED